MGRRSAAFYTRREKGEKRGADSSECIRICPSPGEIGCSHWYASIKQLKFFLNSYGHRKNSGDWSADKTNVRALVQLLQVLEEEAIVESLSKPTESQWRPLEPGELVQSGDQFWSPI